MSRHLQPRTALGILDASLRLFGQNALPLVGLSLLLHLPMVLPRLLTGTGSSDPHEALRRTLWVTLASMLCSIFLSPITLGAFTQFASDRLLGRPASLRSAVAAAWRRYGRMLWVFLLSTLAIGLGFVCLILPGFYLSVVFTLVCPVVLLEDGSGNQALERSWNLVNRDKLKIFGLICVSTILYLGLGTMAGAAIGFTSVRVGLGSGWVVGLLARLMLYALAPLPSLMSVVIYYDLRVRHEGYDLEVAGDDV